MGRVMTYCAPFVLTKASQFRTAKQGRDPDLSPEAALLVGVKHSLLSFHPLDQFLDPIKHSLIGYSGRHALVMLDLAINFDALITHRSFAFVRGGPIAAA
jgi:hypothetical protein